MGRPKKEILGDAETSATKSDEIIVGDPQALRPVELPLVVKPADGSWKNEVQAKFAKVLNAYAYKNVKKWETKKGVLIAQLKELGEHPEKAAQFMGAENPVKINDKRIGQ